MSMILISHDIELIRRYCDCIAVMRDGSIIENADTGKIFSNPQDNYTKELVINPSIISSTKIKF